MSVPTDELAVRAAVLYVPLVVGGGLWAVRRPGRREGAGALLASLWALVALAPVHVVAVRLGWWTFGTQTGTLLGFPVDLWVGWALWWGAVPHLALPRVPVAAVAGAAVAIDLVVMPGLEPVVVLAPRWLLGEGIAVAVALVPAVLLGRWTRDDRRLGARVGLQMVLATGLMVAFVPVVVAEVRGLDLAVLAERPTWVNAGLVQLLALPAAGAIAAVREFAERGGGTPLPYDPPRRLVTSGPYAYVANPMQLSMTLVLGLGGLLLWSGWVAVAAVVGVAYSVGIASWHEDAELAERFGDASRRYRADVRRWAPSWRPYAGIPEASLHVAFGCAECDALGRWLALRNPVGLRIRAAEDLDGPPPERVTYAGSDGNRVSGIRAVARALEHLHLGWALVGWTLRLPPVWMLVQLVADATGAEPRTSAMST